MKLSFFFILYCCQCFAQLESPKAPIFQNEIQRDTIITFSTPEASFPGGYAALQKFINDSIDCYTDFQTDILPTVYLQFIIETDGSLTNVTVKRGISKIIDECCIALIYKMPNWIPEEDGKGNAVRSQCILPIRFQ